jgi:hypothetical protein
MGRTVIPESQEAPLPQSNTGLTRATTAVVQHRSNTRAVPSRQAVPGGGDFGVAAEKIGSGPGA